MVFSSLTFLFAFLPIALIGWYVLPKKLRIGFLLLISLVFYAWGEPLYVLLMIGSILLNWGIGLMMDRSERHKKAWLVASIVLNLALLFVFKYTGLVWNTVRGLLPEALAEKTVSIRLPIGISFFTFQIMSYVIDLYRGRTRVQKNIVKFGAYVSMFPQLIAGPIVRYVDIEAQLDAPERSIEGFADGVRQFVIGLSKKVLLANTMAVLFERFSADPSDAGVLGAWVGLFAYTFQIYFDFSGYSDMACGLGRMLGFRFVRNFDYPYISESITDFWRRWHISLSTWFREYVYIPLGGNRRGTGRQMLNLLIVWALTGLWHGASWNFVLWGLYYGVLLILEKLFLGRLVEKLPKVLRHVYAMLIVSVGWGIFAFTDFSALGAYFGTLVGIGDCGALTAAGGAWCLGFLPTLLVCAFASTPVAANAVKRLERFRWFAPVRLVGTLALFLLCLAALASQSYNPFIYFRF
jgi:alginate O-acetyltransferase complex protein AlgI